jgi:hypothetical protein
MQPHQQRVVTEKAELDEKLGKLTAFLGTPVYSGLDYGEQGRLSFQARYMRRYSEILGERIAAFSEVK